ncbi:helix-turn-helix domain-containing protein [Clostridiaceae bacterium]|nr:helix-turn-helix domain-containing protein [Clostridiaceae bacterium]
MELQNGKTLNDIFALFEDTLTPADIESARLLGEISATIVKKRIELGMTQKAFAAYLGVSQTMVSKWESADYNFSIKALAEIACKLELPLTCPITGQNPGHLASVSSDGSGYYTVNSNVYPFEVYKTQVTKNKKNPGSGSQIVSRQCPIPTYSNDFAALEN